MKKINNLIYYVQVCEDLNSHCDNKDHSNNKINKILVELDNKVNSNEEIKEN